MPDTPEWAKALPTELQSHDAITRTPDLATAAQRLVDLTKYQGASIALPKDGDAESAKAFEEKVSRHGFERTGGKPAKPEDYAAPLDGAAEPVKAAVAAKRQTYFDMGLSKKAAEALLAKDVEALKTQHDASATALAGLKTKFGDALPTVMKNAEKVAEKHGFKNLLGTDIANVPGFYELLNKVGETMSEDGTSGGSGGGSGRTPEAIQTDLQKAMDESVKMVEGSPERKAKEQQIQKFLGELEGSRGKAA
jgi:hypothetical protein